jgi:hypothetical protein
MLGIPAVVRHIDGAQTNAQKRVCTMCTPGASDSVVRASDWAGLAMFSGEGRILWGRSSVRVPPRAHAFPKARGGFRASNRVYAVHVGRGAGRTRIRDLARSGA